MIFSVCSFLFLLSQQMEPLTADSGNCLQRSESDVISKVCCADYENITGTCVPCHDGYTSDIGQNCKPCPTNTFGNLCLGSCRCDNSFQRCDHVKGCIDRISDTFSSTPEQTTDYTNIYSLSTKPTTQHLNNELTTSMFQMEITSNESAVEDTGLASTETILQYAFPVTVSVLLLLLCLVFIKYRKAMQSRQHDITNDQHNRLNMPMNNTDPSAADNIVYETIDETLIDNFTESDELTPDYLDVVDGLSDSNKSLSDKIETTGYQNPYQPYKADQEISQSYDELLPYLKRDKDKCRKCEKGKQTYFDKVPISAAAFVIRVTGQIASKDIKLSLNATNGVKEEDSDMIEKLSKSNPLLVRSTSCDSFYFVNKSCVCSTTKKTRETY